MRGRVDSFFGILAISGAVDDIEEGFGQLMAVLVVPVGAGATLALAVAPDRCTQTRRRLGRLMFECPDFALEYRDGAHLEVATTDAVRRPEARNGDLANDIARFGDAEGCSVDRDLGRAFFEQEEA